jgi:polyisoprenyl-teichoic acid--peptidoglycan teichoic acid transferase
VRRRRWPRLALVVGVLGLLVPGPTVTSEAVLVRVDTAEAVAHPDHPSDVLWVLMLGSDARPGENPLRTRADAIQLVGVDLSSGRGTVIGIPRDSWVAIPGAGRGRINEGLTRGGPQLMAATVADLVGIRADYVLTATFGGLKGLVRTLGGVTVQSRLAFTDDNMPGRVHRGRNRLDDAGALFFARARHYLPDGDFDRSANQQELLRGLLRGLRARADDPGFVERAVLSAVSRLRTDLSPAELFRLAEAATQVDPERVQGCVVRGSYGMVGAASIVFPDLAQARRLGADARADAHVDGGC